VERPWHYTKKALAELYGVSADTIKGDFEAIEAAGFVLAPDDKYRYSFVFDQPRCTSSQGNHSLFLKTHHLELKH